MMARPESLALHRADYGQPAVKDGNRPTRNTQALTTTLRDPSCWLQHAEGKQQLLAAAGPLLVSLALLGLLAVMAADSWLGCNAAMPTHPLIKPVVGPLLAARLQRWHKGDAKLPGEQVSAVLAALAAVVLCLCCKQNCWYPSNSKQPPSHLVVGLAWVIVMLHSAKYAIELCMTGLTRNSPWMGAHHVLTMAALIATVSEPKCICVIQAAPYLMHELYAAVWRQLAGIESSQLAGTFTAAFVVYQVAVFVLASWFVYCWAVQRIIPKHVGLLIAALTCVNYAAHCSVGAGSFCLLEYDQSLDVFYALAEGRRPWLVLFKAGGAAFAVAAAGLSCGFVVLCLSTRCMPGYGATCMQQSSTCASGVDSCVPSQHLLAAGRECGGLVAKVQSKVQ